MLGASLASSAASKSS